MSVSNAAIVSVVISALAIGYFAFRPNGNWKESLEFIPHIFAGLIIFSLLDSFPLIPSLMAFILAIGAIAATYYYAGKLVGSKSISDIIQPGAIAVASAFFGLFLSFF